MLDYLLLGMAVLRLYYLFAFDNGPGNIMLRFRLLLGIKYEKGEPLATNSFTYGLLCPLCSTIWYSLIVVTAYILWPDVTRLIALVLAISMITAIGHAIYVRLLR